MGRKGIFDAYSKGQGSVKMRGTVKHESTEKNEFLVVTEIPFLVQKNRLLEDVSKMVVFMSSDGASHTTGQTISVSGGYSMA